MTTPLENAASALWSALQPAAGESVAYSQGGTTVTATALPGSSPIVAETLDGTIRTDKSQDFVFKSADLLGLVPQRGDTITWGNRVFEVIQPGGDRQYYFSDPYQYMIRVHCKEISAS
jgi:hypothetical protein